MLRLKCFWLLSGIIFFIIILARPSLPSFQKLRRLIQFNRMISCTCRFGELYAIVVCQVYSRKTGQWEQRTAVWIMKKIKRDKYEEDSFKKSMAVKQISKDPTDSQVKAASLKVASFVSCHCVTVWFGNFNSYAYGTLRQNSDEFCTRIGIWQYLFISPTTS